MTVEYLLGDHLGSTGITTDSSGAKVSEIRYKPWGEIRYSWTSGVSTTPAYKLPSYTFTGQYSDSYINLLWYGSRHYDPELGRFIQPDSIVPVTTQGVQAWDRYAYVNNSPMNYIDPTGHFTTKAIWDYLLDYYEGDRKAASEALKTWRDDKDWWGMIRTAQAGDVIFGASGQKYNQFNGFLYQFQGEGDTFIAGISPYAGQGSSDMSLSDLQNGQTTDNLHGTTYHTWFGFVRGIDKTPSFYLRSNTTKTDYTYRGIQISTVQWAGSAMYGSFITAGTLGVGSIPAFFIGTAGGPLIENVLSVNDALDMEKGDVQVSGMGGCYSYYFNFNDAGSGYSLEKYKIQASIGLCAP